MPWQGSRFNSLRSKLLSAVVWGVMYGYARARTGSVYPPLLLHGAMNLLVVAF